MRFGQHQRDHCHDEDSIILMTERKHNKVTRQISHKNKQNAENNSQLKTKPCSIHIVIISSQMSFLLYANILFMNRLLQCSVCCLLEYSPCTALGRTEHAHLIFLFKKSKVRMPSQPANVVRMFLSNSLSKIYNFFRARWKVNILMIKSIQKSFFSTINLI